jgi:hypothetical protein
MPPRVDSASESDADSVSESGDSDANEAATHTYNSTGNHRNFAATPAGHTVTMTANLQQRPRLGQDTLDRIDFDMHTDTDTEHRGRRPQRPSANLPQRSTAASQGRPANASFASPRAAATNTFGMNAADYQQHLASRTLTSPAIRTLIGDRSKSPDSPTPAPSIDGVLHAGKHRSNEHHNSSRPQPRATRQASVSAFEDLARQLQHDVELTRGANNRGRLAEDADDASASNSGGSGFGPGSHASSARTRVDSDNGRTRNKAFEPAHFNAQGFPAQQKTAAAADMTVPWGVRLPDVTGLTSALGSPVKGRDAVEHRPFDAAVGNQDARLDELAHLRGFVDGIQVELDRAGERILNLEQAHEQQSHDFQGLRSEMQSALNSVRASQPHDDEQLVQRILRQLRVSPHEHQHAAHGVVQDRQPQSAPAPAAVPSSEARAARGVQADVRAPCVSPTREHSQVEVVNRLYAELEQLRTTMEEHYRSAAGLASDGGAQPSAREQVYQHRDHWPAGRDPWDAIEALRLQVLSLASEVERLSGVVASGARQRHSRSDAARYRFEAEHREASHHEAHAASDPGETGRYARSSTPPRANSHSSHAHRRVSFGRSSPTRFAEEGATSDDYDRTLDAVAENVRVQRERQRRRATVADDEEISQLASARAERASARVSGGTHDAGRCSVCASTARSDRRRASRKARLLAAEQRRDAVQLEESVLLSAAKLTGEQEETLRTVLQEHWDEFVHQRMLYAELADELKAFDPAMSKPKRTLLAQHVLEAVEALEQKADRINRLEELLKTPQPQQNRLRNAIESFEKARQNSPPTSMQL